MGNRAVIKFEGSSIGMYLHWNGGRDTIEPLLQYCKLRGFRCGSYGIARMAQVMGNFFGGGLSVGVDDIDNLDCNNGDNGLYIVKDWEIVGRRYFKNRKEQDEYNPLDVMLSLDEAQPETERIGDYIKAEEVPIDALKIGDRVCFLDSLSGAVVKSEIAGFGDDVVNGTDRTGKPYCNEYGDDPKNNPNNYREDFRRIVEEEQLEPLQPALDEKEAEPPRNADQGAEITINDELKGIEIKFASKPSEETREALKRAGFRWHRKKAVWYAKNNPDRMDVATKIINAVSQ